jgi:hypothetical protein
MSKLNVYKASDGGLPLNNVKFVSWKIKEGSKVSVGSILFTFEYINPADNQTKTEKFKCKLNGITVKKLSKLSQGDIIQGE